MSLDVSTIYPIIQALGWALVHFVWQGAAVGAVYALGMVVLRNAPPAWRYGFGLFALGLLAVAPVLTYLITLPQVAVSLATTASQPALPTFTAGAAASSVSSVPVVAEGQSVSQFLQRALPWIVAAWGLGVVLQSCRVFVCWRRMRALTRAGIQPVGRDLMRRTSELCELLGVRRAVAVFESRRVDVPTVLGWLKPVILLPTSTLVGLTPRQIELVIAHELGHVRRWDYVVNLLQVGIETALFYHPVVRWISQQVREEREKCCDDLVIKHCGDRLDYAKALHKLETFRSPSPTPALAATDGQLVQRIERIVAYRGDEVRHALPGNALLVVFLALAVLMAGRLADPVGALEQRRAALADTLVQELLLASMPRHSEAFMVPLQDVRVSRSAEAANEAAGPSALAATSADVVETPVPAAPAPVRQERRPDLEARTLEARVAPDVAPGSDTEQPVVAVDEAPAAEPATQAREVEALAFVDVDATRLPPPAPIEIAEPQLPAVEPAGPVAIERRAPEYPVRARMAGVTGYVELSFQVDSEGSPFDIEIEASHPRRVFEKSSLRALKRWRFDRSTRSTGIERVSQRFDFTMENSSPLMGQDQRECIPITGTRICRSDSPTFLKAREAAAN